MDAQSCNNIRSSCTLIESDSEEDESFDAHNARDVYDVCDVTQTIGGLCEVLKSKVGDPCMKAHVEDFQLKIMWLLEMLEVQHPRPILRINWLMDIEPTCIHE
jgi:hypothetical protein